MASIEFNLQGLPPSANKRLHHMARHRENQTWKASAHYAALDAANRSGLTFPWDRVHVSYIFHYPRRTLADFDNLIGSAKPVLDGVRGVVIPDDSSRYVHRLSASIEVDRGQDAGIRVVIEQCSCEDPS